jgi:hypothetical protein
MRCTFFDSARLKEKAKENVESGFSTLKRWWSDKYNLPPNHTLFLGQSKAALMLELYEDLHQRKKEITRDLESANTRMEERVRLGEALRGVNAILEGDGKEDDDPNAPVVTGDPLVDRWERELAEGKTPDLTEGMITRKARRRG